MDNKKPVIVLAVIFTLSIVSLVYIYSNFPHLSNEEKQHIKLPRNMRDAKNLGKVLSRYKDRYFNVVLAAVCCTYIFLQSFAIPGSIFLSILSGYLFGWLIALLLICTCSAVGASVCYLLSMLFAGPLLYKYFGARMNQFADELSRHRQDLFNYLLFLRITPLLPNWLINLSAPWLKVPWWPFFWATFFGVAPPSLIAIQTGRTLLELTDVDDDDASGSGGRISYRNVVLVLLCGGASLLPVLFRRRLKEKVQ